MIRTTTTKIEIPSLMRRTKQPKTERVWELVQNPLVASLELNNRSLYHFIQYFWDEISTQPLVHNWHIPYICSELEQIAYRVGNRQDKVYDLIINIPPGTTKTITCSIMFPAWCWTKWHWMRFITASYTSALALESAEYCRDLIRSDKFQVMYPWLDIKEDKDTKSNFKIVKKESVSPGREPRILYGGNRFSTSVGGTLTGFHGDINIWDDPLNPEEAVSDKDRETANRWIDGTLSTRKTNKKVSTTIGIMQRLHQDDPTGHLLAKKKKNLRHICLPGEIKNYGKQLSPPELKDKYIDDLLDPKRMDWKVLRDMEADLGQYGYAGQIGQDPTPPGGGMFKVDHLQTIRIAELDDMRKYIVQSVRYWDKAGSANTGAWTVGVLMHKLANGKFVIEDVKRGQWAAEVRESLIRSTAEADGRKVWVYMEQEPGSGGKDSVQASIRGLAGFAVYADRPTGDKAFRADPFAVQVNNDNVMMLQAEWNAGYVEELRFFPFSTYKDRVDASSGGFMKLTEKRFVKTLSGKRKR
jgi:predicted phage terminase large subunit-like protein